MRFKTIFCVALMFIVGTSLAAFSQAIKDGPFEVKNVVKSTEKDVLPTVIVRCPDQQHIGQSVFRTAGNL